MAGISKAFLKRLTGMIKDPEELAAIKSFLAEHGHEIQANKLQVIDDYLFYSGSIGPCTFFKLYDQFLVRSRTSLDGRRFKNDPAFSASRESASRFALGNKLASKLYRMVEGEKKAYSLFCFLKRKAILLIKEGKSVMETEEILLDYLNSFDLLRNEQKQKEKEDQLQGKKVKEKQDHKFFQFQFYTMGSEGMQVFSHRVRKAMFSPRVFDSG